MTRNYRIQTAIAGLSIVAGAAALGYALAPSCAFAQDINSTSGSDANAVSGSQSGAQSISDQGQFQTANNAGIGNSESVSASGAEANSGSASWSESSGNEQGQSQGQSLSSQVGQQATNSQGVAVSNTFNSTNRKITEVRTNAAVPLAASVSFSADYCGGTASGGASIAPIGVSIGGAAPTFDHTCQYIRLAQTGGMMAANWHNMGEMDMRNRMMTFATWATCMAGPDADKRRRGTHENVVMEACLRLGLLGSEGSPLSPPAVVTPQPAITQPDGHPTPEAVEQPRGELQYESVPVIQTPPIAAMVALPR